MATANPNIDDMPSKSVDGPPGAGEESEDERIPPPPENSPWKVYLKGQWLTILLSKNKLIYGFSIGFWYLLNFIGSVAVVNLYSDKDRLIPCDVTGKLAVPDEASKVFDLPLVMLAVWHMIEWIRTTVLLSVVCIGVNWMTVWYATMPNTLFGLVTYAIVHMSYFSDEGKLCKDFQEHRANWLLGEIIGFWSVFFCFVFPFLCTLCMGRKRADDILKKNYEDAGEEND